ncbi:hypothetical protein F5Y16DRAFT_423211 [Xylariaceae sp. FL0255]|nr:hypothetical protein F5Y16DRAFT_423211 [Xylariaceae sp. FL0255]
MPFLTHEDHTNLPKLFSMRHGSPQPNVLLVAFDVEGTGTLQNGGNGQVGVAILDPKKLYNSEVSARDMITTYNFAHGDMGYMTAADTKFLFGDSRSMNTLHDLMQSTEALIPTDRKIIYVGHGIGNDIKSLEAIGFDFSKYSMTAVDTYDLAKRVLHKRLTLGNLLSELQCQHSGLHCAGNDANFALRAMLLLSSRLESNSTRQRVSKTKIAILEAIAHGKEIPISLPYAVHRSGSVLYREVRKALYRVLHAAPHDVDHMVSQAAPKVVLRKRLHVPDCTIPQTAPQVVLRKQFHDVGPTASQTAPQGLLLYQKTGGLPHRTHLKLYRRVFLLAIHILVWHLRPRGVRERPLTNKSFAHMNFDGRENNEYVIEDLYEIHLMVKDVMLPRMESCP